MHPILYTQYKLEHWCTSWSVYISANRIPKIKIFGKRRVRDPIPRFPIFQTNFITLPDLDFGKRAPGTIIPKVDLIHNIRNIEVFITTCENTESEESDRWKFYRDLRTSSGRR